MRRSMVAGVLLVVSAGMVAGPAFGGGTKPGKPIMKLRVSTHSGMTPLSLDVTGSFTAGEPAEITGCLVTVDRTYTTPGGNTLISKEELPCVEPQAEAPAASVPASFKKTMTLKEPGIYSYRMVLIGQDGKRMASVSQEVKVFVGRVEAGVGAHVTTNRR